MTSLDTLLLHYSLGTQDMETRKTRKPGGWDDIINAYMGRLPANWPYISVFTDPMIRTTILEKTARLLNAKLRGRLVPREGGDVIKAKIQNAILDFQWDNANQGGPMIEKIASADQSARLFGGSWVLVYWDNVKNSNEIKVIDVRDIFFDPSCNHIRNAKWVQIREYTNAEGLARRGYDVKKLKKLIKDGAADYRSTNYTSQVKSNRGLEDMTGRDVANPVIEVITEWTPETKTVFAPRYGLTFEDGANKYEHGMIPVAQLRYYPLQDDIVGESEVESVLGLQKAINACLCGFFDEMNLAMRPPLKIISGQVRMSSIEYGPGARWIMQNPNAVSEAQLGASSLAAFNTTYSALKAAFNTAMGSQSLGMSNVGNFQKDKTATEVNSLTLQQNSRDQYNQLYLAEFLKDIMMMWVSNNKQYLFDDPTKQYIVLKIIGKDKIKDFKMMNLDDKEIPESAMKQIADTIREFPDQVSNDDIEQIMEEVAVPKNPVILNPETSNPEEYEVKNKLSISKQGDSADLYVTKDDMDGVYDYEPDVRSMAVGASEAQQKMRQQAYQMVMNSPVVLQELSKQGVSIKFKEVLTNLFEDGGYRDAESMFETIQPADTAQPNPQFQPMMPQGGINAVQQAGPGSSNPSPISA